MPNEGDPNYAAWKAGDSKSSRLSRQRRDSCRSLKSGGTDLVNTLAEQSWKPEYGAILLISAPFVGEGGWPAGDLETPRTSVRDFEEVYPVHVYPGGR